MDLELKLLKLLASHLDVDLIVSWTMYGPIEPKSHHKYSAVHRKPVHNSY